MRAAKTRKKSPVVFLPTKSTSTKRSMAWPKDYCWGNAATHWRNASPTRSRLPGTAAIRGVEGGGLVEGLPAVNFKTDEGDVVLKCPTEVSITDRREKELNDLTITLVHREHRSCGVLWWSDRAEAEGLQDPQATANARLSSQSSLRHGRVEFAHYIKAMMRDKGRQLHDEGKRSRLPEQVDRGLRAARRPRFAEFEGLVSTARSSHRRRRRRRQARVYKAVVYLRPHFQLDELTASIRLVAERRHRRLQ